jgi:hypothetical protein
VQRQLHYAIVDEVDSILIDEAGHLDHLRTRGAIDRLILPHRPHHPSAPRRTTTTPSTKRRGR